MAIQRDLLAFFALAFGWSWACWLGSAAMGDGRVDGLSTSRLQSLTHMAGQFGPLVAALVMTAWESGAPGLREFGARLVRWRFHPKWLAVALLLPPAMYYAAVFAHAAVLGETAPLRPYRFGYDVVANFFVILLIGGPLGEEPGWRGYAMPRMLSAWRSRTAAITALGFIWLAWHFPIWWIGGEFPVWVIVQSAVAMTAMSFLFVHLYERSGESTLICILFHGSFNTFFLLLPIEWAHVSYTIVVSLVAAGVEWWRWRSLKQRQAEAREGAARASDGVMLRTAWPSARCIGATGAVQ